jgi:hypothetical protein
MASQSEAPRREKLMSHVEYIGKIHEDGSILLPDEYRETYRPGSMVRVMLQPLHNDNSDNERKASSGQAPTGRQYLGQDSENIATEALLVFVAEDWKDWANPEEDIYDEFKEHLDQR